MTGRIRIILTLTTVVLALGCFTFEQSTPAQSESSYCKQVKGNLIVEFGPGTASGAITNGSFLNGTVETVFTPGSVAATADPTSVTFTGDSAITTDKGVITTHDLYLFDFATELGSGMLRIDPAASTGDFAGATGIIYLNINAGDPPGHARLGGRICFASE